MLRNQKSVCGRAGYHAASDDVTFEKKSEPSIPSCEFFYVAQEERGLDGRSIEGRYCTLVGLDGERHLAKSGRRARRGEGT